MNRVWGKALVVTGLVLMLGIAPSWGQAPPNIVESGANENTAGGKNALQSIAFAAVPPSRLQQPPPSSPSRLPVTSHPSCPCPTARAGGLPLHPVLASR